VDVTAIVAIFAGKRFAAHRRALRQATSCRPWVARTASADSAGQAVAQVG
jgi:hypothetical protein